MPSMTIEGSPTNHLLATRWYNTPIISLDHVFDRFYGP